LKYFLSDSWHFAIVKLFLYRLNPLSLQALVAYLMVHLLCAAIMAAMQILLPKEGIVVIRSMILTSLLCPNLFQMTFAFFSSFLEAKSFAMCVGKFSYVLSSSGF